MKIKTKQILYKKYFKMWKLGLSLGLFIGLRLIIHKSSNLITYSKVMIDCHLRLIIITAINRCFLTVLKNSDQSLIIKALNKIKIFI
jgi:hypothetical protein